MPQAVPNGWAADPPLTSLLPSTPQGEVPIKSEITYNGEKYAVITNSKGEYKVFVGGTGLFNQQISETAEIFRFDQSGRGSVGTASRRQNTRDLFGGKAGINKLADIARKQVSQGLSEYLTAEEKNNLQNPKLKSSIVYTQPQPSDRDPSIENGGSDQEGTGSGQENDPNPNISEKGFNNLENVTDKFDTLSFGNIKQYLTYPESMNDGQDRITFTQYKYIATTISKDTIIATAQSFANRNKELQTTKIQGFVTLPIPNQISETNQTGWGESSLSTIGAFAMGKLGGAAQDFSTFEVGSAFNKVENLFRQLGTSPVTNRAQSYVAAKVASQIISSVGVTVDPEAYINRVTGAAINPNLELLFNGPKLRPFSFSFKMTARSEKEAKNIRAIIKFFKAGMAPQRSNKSDVSLYLGSPNVFQVEYKSDKDRNLDGIGRIKMCALQSCAINYTPDGVYAAYDDNLVGSQPIAIEMQLQLIEITPVFADEYDLSDVNGIPIGPDKSDNLVITPESSTQEESGGITPGGNLGGIDLPGIDLPGINLPGINLPGIGIGQ